MFNVYKIDKQQEKEFSEQLSQKKSFGDRTKIKGKSKHQLFLPFANRQLYSNYNLFANSKSDLNFVLADLERTERLSEKHRKRIGHFVAKMITKPVVMADTNTR